MLKILEVAVAHKSSMGSYGIFFFFLEWMIVKYCANEHAKSFYWVSELDVFMSRTHYT